MEMKAIRIQKVGGPEAMQFEDTSVPEPRPGEARVRMEAIGVNFIDVYHRTGLYPAPIPFTPGMEGAGVVDAVGENVEQVRVGDRVAYAMSLGSYAEQAVVEAWKLVPVPEGLDSHQAAAAMLQGLTSHYLVHSTFPIQPGHTALIHAAAGGVGLLLVQIAKKAGAKVFGTVSTEEKAKAAKAAGADEIILYTQSDFEAEVGKFTDGKGVNVVYDSVGQATYEKSLKCLMPRGMLVLYGNASGPVPPIDPLLLSNQGSVFLTRPRLFDYAQNSKEVTERSNELLSWITSGEVRLTIDRELPLKEAAEAHRLLEARKTSGKLLLIP
jgi:NADPH2:quinone reductase